MDSISEENLNAKKNNFDEYRFSSNYFEKAKKEALKLIESCRLECEAKKKEQESLLKIELENLNLKLKEKSKKILISKIKQLISLQEEFEKNSKKLILQLSFNILEEILENSSSKEEKLLFKNILLTKIKKLTKNSKIFKHFKIELSLEDFELCKDALSQLEIETNISKKPLEKGTIVLKTENGTITLKIENELENLKNILVSEL